LIPGRQLLQAVETLHKGGLIAYPTEAVWGLGCDPLNSDAVQRLLKLKQRPAHKGLILVAASLQQCLDWLAPLTEEQHSTLNQSWPGFQTWVIPVARWVPYLVKGDHDSIAVRVSSHPLIQQLCLAFDGPLISTSANHSALPPICHQWQLKRAFGRQIDAIIPGKLAGESRPSSIRDLLTGKVLR